MKYVILTTGKQDVPIIFPDVLVHADVALKLRTCLLTGPEGKFLQPVSAGTVIFSEDGVVCLGESTTLQLKSRPQDADIINWYDQAHGIIGQEQVVKALVGKI